MFYLLVVFMLLIDIHAKPFSSSSNNLNAREYAEETALNIASFSSNLDLVPTDNTEGSPSQNGVVPENTIDEAGTRLLSFGCTSDASTENPDQNTVLKREQQRGFCSSDTPTSINPKPPSGDAPDRKYSLPKKIQYAPPTTEQRTRCSEFPYEPYHVTCGGPETGLQSFRFQNQLITIVANCVAGPATEIPSRPPGVFARTKIVAQYCCGTPISSIIYKSMTCNKLFGPPIAELKMNAYREWLKVLEEQYGVDEFGP